MGKTRDLFKKIRDTKGKFHVKMARNGMDLTEAEDIKKRWQEYTEELYKKDLHDQDNHDGMIIHLEPDVLECEVKWALGRITTNRTAVFTDPAFTCFESQLIARGELGSHLRSWQVFRGVWLTREGIME